MLDLNDFVRTRVSSILGRQLLFSTDLEGHTVLERISRKDNSFDEPAAWYGLPGAASPVLYVEKAGSNWDYYLVSPRRD